MALLKKTQRSFAGGQLDKDLMGRQDLNKYSQGCLTLENFKVRKQGNVIKRSGTDLVCDFTGLLDGAPIQTAKLIPLVQERERGLYILITAGHAYLVSPEGMKMENGTWSRTPTYSNSPYAIAVPFADSDLAMLDWCQSGDTLFFAHRSYPPGKMMYSGGELEYERIVFRRGGGTPPRISSIDKLGTWNGTGGLVYVEYAVTAVKDGVESAMSTPFATEYNAPWGTGNSIRINIDTSGLEPGSWDCFYVYKKEADVFGLIGTTSGRTAFVDISSGFSVNGTLFPSDFSQFDKPVHLREGANKFAPVRAVTEETVTTIENSIDWNGRNPASVSQREAAFISSHQGTTTETETGETTRTATAQKLNPEGAILEFTLPSAGVIFSEFTVGVGSLLHNIAERTEVTDYRTWRLNSYDTPLTQSDSYVTLDPKWVGTSSIFTPSPAKYYTAQVQYYDNGSWRATEQFDCTAVVDQSNPGSEWSQVSGSSPTSWRREYEEDQTFSSADAATCAARMNAYVPSVGASVRFVLPSAIAGKKLVKAIKIRGWTNSSKTTSARMIVNGIACFQQGAYVNKFTDDYITPDLTVTPPKSEDHFLNPGEYPGCVQLYSQRLVYASTAMEPFKFWMSCTGDLYNFDVHEYIRASDAISASTAALEMPRINRMLVHRDLMLFADGGEWQVAPSTGNAVAPSTIAAKLQSVIGCAAWIKPIPIESDIIFCDGSGETLMATRYNFASDGYESSNLSVLSQRIFRNNPIKAMAYVQFPESTIECVLADGTVASLVYMKEHDVCAWSHHTFGGGWRAKDVAANKSETAGSSDCAFLATRSYEENGASIREWAILGLRDIDPNDNTALGNVRMDAVRIASADPNLTPIDGTIYDLLHLRPGEIATLIEIISNDQGEILYDVFAIGCPFKSVMKTTSPEFTDQETAQMEIKNATESEIRVIDGSDFTVRQPEVPANRATTMKVSPKARGFVAGITTGRQPYVYIPGDADCRLPLVGNNSRNGSVVLEHDGIWPLSVLSVTTSYRVEYANHANGGSADD